MAGLDRDLQAAIAVTRFGLGARPDEIAEAARDPQAFLLAQIGRAADLPSTSGDTAAMRIATYHEVDLARRDARNASGGKPPADVAMAIQAAQRGLAQKAAADLLARARLGAATQAGFRERWALFWANHFTVAGNSLNLSTLVVPYEVEAIRPRVFGRFADLLVAAETHPSMLLYLDQVQSVGPNSPAVRNREIRNRLGVRARGLNENLARETLELHTVGVGGGYTQADVTELARAMTGLSVGEARSGQMGEAVYRPFLHEPGTRTVMGVRYPDGGAEQVQAVLTDLAAKPQTARFICGKIARHFVADQPPPALTGRLERAWLSSGGRLDEVARALVTAPEAWAPEQTKFKTPYEFMISSYRAVGAAPQRAEQVAPALKVLGQPALNPPSPEGWPEETEAWAAPDAIVKRMTWAERFAAQAARAREPGAVAADALGARLRPATAAAVARAESRPEALALLLMSPEFQRR